MDANKDPDKPKKVTKKSLRAVQRILNKRDMRLRQARALLAEQLNRLRMEEALLIKLRAARNH